MPSGNIEPQQERPTIQEHPHQFTIYILSSAAHGVVATGVFAPVDRAIFLALTNQRPVMMKANFVSPYQGCLPAMGHKCLFGSIYYIAQDLGRAYLFPLVAERLNLGTMVGNLSVGLFAGTLNGIIGNPLTAVKYQAWGDDKAKYLKTAREMWQTGKWKPFTTGTQATVYRDSVFGASYEVLRNQLRLMQQSSETLQTAKKNGLPLDFVINTTSGILASILASPINYARNIQHHHMQQILKNKIPPQPQPNVTTILSMVNKDSRNEKNLLCRLNFFSRTFKPWWGASRAGGGIALGQLAFELSKDWFQENLPRRKKI